jgi:hypothetical protein
MAAHWLLREERTPECCLSMNCDTLLLPRRIAEYRGLKSARDRVI